MVFIKKRFLEDGRVFQLFAFDFILDKDMNLWLTDIKTNPNYSLKNRELIERILQRQYMILNHRSEMQHNFFVSAKKELDGHIESGGIEVLYKEEYERQVKRNINMDQKLVELKTAMTS